MRAIVHVVLAATAVSSVFASLNLKQTRPSLYATQQKLAGLFDEGRSNGEVRRQVRAPPPGTPGAASSSFLNAKTAPFLVNGTSLPMVNFDVGDSFAGSLPVGDTTETYFFWFWPSANPAAQKEITLWISGGPGCASSGEMMQENGPFLWPPGVYRPEVNPFSWHLLTNMVWIDQPFGAGFSRGKVTIHNEEELAKLFLAWWKNFIALFGMQGYKVYVTGSSYSGMYCPYVAKAMLDTNDTTNFDVHGMQIFDGVFGQFNLQEDVVLAPMVDQFSDAFNFNDSTMANIHDKAKSCGYNDYISKYLVFPSSGQQPSVLPGQKDDYSYKDGCDLINQVYMAAHDINPCFSIYDPYVQCPRTVDPLGFADDSGYVPAGYGEVYLNRDDVKAAIHAPRDKIDWKFCSDDPVFFNGTDDTLLRGPASQPALPHVIDRTKNVIIGQGRRDVILIAEGTLLAIQNITWGGQRGFQTKPTGPLYVPYGPHGGAAALANASAMEGASGGGVLGTAHSERGLTFVGVQRAGHFLAQNQPAVAYRSLEVLLGRVPGFTSMLPFSTDTEKTPQPSASSLGQGTFSMPLVNDVGGRRPALQQHSSAAGKNTIAVAGIWLPVLLWGWLA